MLASHLLLHVYVRQHYQQVKQPFFKTHLPHISYMGIVTIVKNAYLICVATQ